MKSLKDFKQKPKVLVQAKIPDDVLKRLDSFAKRADLSRSQAIYYAILELLKTMP